MKGDEAQRLAGDCTLASEAKSADPCWHHCHIDTHHHFGRLGSDGDKEAGQDIDRSLVLVVPIVVHFGMSG